MKLVLIRHGESIANATGIWQGQLDFPLSAKGLEQAQQIAQWLRQEKIDVLYSSDLVRAKKTAQEIVRYHNVEVVTTQQLREINLGRFQGLTEAEFKEKYPEFVHIDWLQSGLEDVEQMEQLFARTRMFLSELLQHHFGKKIMAVSHGGFINGFLMALLNISWKGRRVFTIENTSMTTIQFHHSSQFVILGVNETPHLSPQCKNLY